MDRIELSEQFYEDEVREGFYIPSAIKKAWGAEIQILNELDKVCRKLGIRYFAAWGTFLGAVRHGGYVPWDDDLDICMLRDDYNKFLDEGLKLMPKGFTVYNLETKKSHDQFLANLVSKNRICFEPEHLKRYHGFPYVTGIDVFILDYIPLHDKEGYEAMKDKASHILAVSFGLKDGNLKGKSLAHSLDVLKDKYGVTVPSGMSEEDMRSYLDIMVEKLFASFLGERSEAKEIVQMMPWGLKDIKIMPKFYYDVSVDIPFESGTIPVPQIYDDALRTCYGDYMQLYKNAGAHGYPFFKKSRQQLQEVLDFELPEYSVDTKELIKAAEERKEILKRRATRDSIFAIQEYSVKASEEMSEETIEETPETYKSVVRECLVSMEEKLKALDTVVGGSVLTDVCTDAQQLAMDLGMYMETFKGEGYDIVHELEQLCEDLYNLSATGEETLKNRVNDIFKSIRDKSLRRREVLFLPFKDEYWNSMKSVYEAFMAEEDTDVYVVPIPYYHKDYRGQFINMQYAVSGYPSDIKITNYDQYDYSLRHPDIIVINTPYDDQNEEISVPPFFYSDRLLEYTERLVYIPWFRTYDFSRENAREYINMDYYCTVPGIMNADTVLLQSETIRETYIEKLVGFTGESTRKLWEGKLMVEDSDEAYALLGLMKDICEDEDKEHTSPGNVSSVVAAQGNVNGAPLKDETDQTAEKMRKTLLYYPDFSNLLLYGDRAIDKIGRVLELFDNSKDSLDYVLLQSELIETIMKNEHKDIYDKFESIIDKACTDMSLRRIDEINIDINELVDSCTAYYGDGGHIAHMFRNAGKPVMIQNYEL